MDNLIDKLTRFAELLVTWNWNFHFTNLTKPEEILEHLVYPSLALSLLIPENSLVVDMGSGPGIPSVPIAISRPDLDILCVDSAEAAIEFITAFTAPLGITNVRGITGRVEAVAHDPEFRETFDISIARAFAPIPIAVEAGSAFIKSDGSVIIQCADQTSSKLRDNDLACMKAGCMFDRIGAAVLDKGTAISNFIAFRKVSDTDPRFPRSWPAMKSRPLWK
jgi:16S rRNA (guanine527-N7)-methyltransferase